jgi:hypothetical protein
MSIPIVPFKEPFREWVGKSRRISFGISAPNSLLMIIQVRMSMLVNSLATRQQNYGVVRLSARTTIAGEIEISIASPRRAWWTMGY